MPGNRQQLGLKQNIKLLIRRVTRRLVLILFSDRLQMIPYVVAFLQSRVKLDVP